MKKPRQPTVRQLKSARNTLYLLSQESTDGKLRDAIAAVRHALYDEIEARTPPEPDETVTR